MAKTIFDIRWLDLIPESIRGDKEVQNIADAVTPEQQAISRAIRECIILARLDELPEQVVDLLAWQYHVDFYEMEFPITTKRDLVRQSIEWHRYKGTPWVVEQVVAAVYGNCKLTEWYEYGGEPYYFRVEIKLNQESTDKNRWKKVIRAINSVKNTRSWLEKMLFYYPDILLPFKIHHRAEITQLVNAKQIFWNLGSFQHTRRDGIYTRNAIIRYGGIKPDTKYRERQSHALQIEMLAEPIQKNIRSLNQRNGCFLHDGSHRRNGIQVAEHLINNCCTVTSVKNGAEGEIEAI